MHMSELLEARPAADRGVFAAYHVSPTKFKTFHPYSHFGSLRAAKTVVKIKQRFGSGITSVYLYSCRLHLVHPLRLSYEEANDDASLFQAVRSGKYDDRYPQLRRWAADSQSRFEDYGFDGIIYPNRLDDGGKNSFIIFDPENVEIVSVQSLSLRDFSRLRSKSATPSPG